jgi:hypothetical protein
MRKLQLTIEGVTFDVAPTPVVKLAAVWPLIRTAEGLQSEGGQAAVISAVFWGARRAKAQITEEWLQENVDVHNFRDVFDVFTDLNVLSTKKGDASAEQPQVGEPAGEATQIAP